MIRTFYATRDLKNPSYGTRMLRAGDPVELDGPKAKLYLALGAVSPTKPRSAKPNPLDHDGDGKAGGSAKGAASTRAKGAVRKRKAKK